MAPEYLVVSKAPATPVELLVEVCLRGKAEGDEPRRLIRALQPAVSDHGLIILPLAGKFVMLGHAEDVGIFVRPDFAVASNGDNLVDDKETKVEVGFPATDAVLRPGPILEDLHAPLVDGDIGGLMNFQAEFCSHHSRQFGPFPAGYHPGVQWRERHVLQFFLAVGIRAESLVAVKDANFVGGNSGGPFVS